MNLYEKFEKISEYLTNNSVQYSHFVEGVYIVQDREDGLFSPKFFLWLDKNNMVGVYVSVIVHNVVYAIVVKED